jgi:hypothetical protein
MENYINMHGSMTHARKVHKRKMAEAHKPWVTYATFRHRIVNLHWTVEKAIHTPAQVKNRDKDRRRKVKLQRTKFKLYIILYKVKKFFK